MELCHKVSWGGDSVSAHILYGQKIVRLARENVPNHSRGAGDRIGMNWVYIYGDRNGDALFYWVEKLLL